jgi:hypothetical protein
MSNSFNTQPLWFDTDTSTGGNTNWRGTSGCTLGGIAKMGIKPTRILVVPATAGAAVVTGTILVADPQTSPSSTGGLLSIPIVSPAASEPFEPFYAPLDQTSALWRDFVVTGLTAAKVALQIWYRT